VSRVKKKKSVQVVQLPKAVRVGGVDFHALSEAECVMYIIGEIQSGRGGWVVTANLDHVRRSQGESSYASLMRKADLVVADGMPIIWAAALQGTRLPGRVAGSNLVSSLARSAAIKSQSVFLLGGDPGTAETAGEVLIQENPGLRIAGCHCPMPGFEKRPGDMETIRQKLTAARPDIVYVALGSPKQELLIERYRRLLPSTWWIGVGISFSFLAGDLRRAPIWLQRIGGEWILRLIQEPGRMSKRYLVHGIPFALSLLGKAAFRRVTGRGIRGDVA
jgi:N-acetylglucosaminyldiphosphoundecaprenol N-acetyl-beta-D-mannosaminyltransferase